LATSASLERPLALTPTDKSHSRGRLAFAIVFALVVAASAPTTGDFGLTWDEPTYRTSQRYTEYWWRDLAQGRSINDLQRLIDPEALLFYWPYARHGLNFHPPLAGQISLLSGRLLGGFLQAYPARRMATVFEFALAVALLFTFLRKRSGIWVAGVSAAALVLMPRVYGQAHLMDTDIPGMALWLAAALACWKGVEEPKGGAWRIATGILLGLCFVEKMAAVTVLLPLVAWLGARGARRWWRHRDDRTAAALDLIITSALILAPLVAIAFEVRRLSEGQLAAPPLQLLPPPQRTNLFIHRPQSLLPDWFLVLPTAAWLLRCLLRRTLGNNRILSRERPTIEAWAAIAGLAPLVARVDSPTRSLHHALIRT
jgi:4-amino-4-deoxy-L-arabinose transferase-like glycosyltransferase